MNINVSNRNVPTKAIIIGEVSQCSNEIRYTYYLMLTNEGYKIYRVCDWVSSIPEVVESGDIPDTLYNQYKIVWMSLPNTVYCNGKFGKIIAWGIERGFNPKGDHPIEQTDKITALNSDLMPHVLIQFRNLEAIWYPAHLYVSAFMLNVNSE